MRHMIRDFVRRESVSSLNVAMGSEVLDEYTKHKPDFILMDIKMKDVDGFAATRQIKNAFSKAESWSFLNGTLPPCDRPLKNRELKIT